MHFEVKIAPILTVALNSFYRAMLTHSAVMRLHVVRPSVCLLVTIGYRVQIGWNSSKIISRPNSLRSMRALTPNMGNLVQREHPQNRVEYGWGQEHIKRVLALKRCKIGPKLLLWTNRKSHMRFRLAPNLSTLDELERLKRPFCRNR